MEGRGNINRKRSNVYSFQASQMKLMINNITFVHVLTEKTLNFLPSISTLVSVMILNILVVESPLV